MSCGGCVFSTLLVTEHWCIEWVWQQGMGMGWNTFRKAKCFPLYSVHRTLFNKKPQISNFPFCFNAPQPRHCKLVFMNYSWRNFKPRMYLLVDPKAVVSSIKIDDNQSDHKMLQNSFPHRLITLDRDHPRGELAFVPASPFLNNNGQSPDQSFHPTSRTSCLLKMKGEGSEGEPKPRERKETFCKSATIDQGNYWNWMERCLRRK